MKTAGFRKEETAARVEEAAPVTETEEREERLHAVAQRLYPKVQWERMSEAAVRRALGQPQHDCPQRREYEAGRLARAAGEAPASDASMAFRTGWRHGKPPRARRRRWRARQGSDIKLQERRA